MTNKINGIDVSECPIFDKKTGCYHTFDGECVKDSCTVYKWILEHKRLQEENEELKKYQYTQEYLQNEIEKKQKALEEIREKCLKMCNICDNIDGETYLDDCNSICEYCKIVKLINEVLNDRD